MKTLTTIISLVFVTIMFSQEEIEKKQLAVFGGANYQPILKGRQIGFDFNGRYYLDEKISIGVEFAYAFKNYNQGFGFETDRTLMHNVILNSVIQYDFFKTQKVFAGAFVSNGVSIITLRDRNDTKIREVSEEIDGFWHTREVEVPKRLNRDSFYLLTPGIDISYKALTLDQDFNTHLYITYRIGYQFAFGEGDFAKPKNFTDFVFSLGVTIKGDL